jgi:ribosomal protein S17
MDKHKKELDFFLKVIQEQGRICESKKTSFVKVTRQTKIDRAIGALATKLAKEMNDPYYKKMVKFREKYFAMRDRIKTKYGPKVRARAISGKGVSDLVAKIKNQRQK